MERAITRRDVLTINDLLSDGLINKNNINLRNREDGWTFLMVASRYSIGIPGLVKRLLDLGADPNIRSGNGWTALMLAARNSKTDSSSDIVKTLLEYGADPNLQNNTGTTALIFAASWSDLTSVKSLLDHDADPNIRTNKGNTALYFVNTNIDIVKTLLDYGADPYTNKRDSIEDFTECGKLKSKAVWDRINQNINRESRQYSRSGDFRLPKDIWRLILLRQRVDKLSATMGYYVWWSFAESLNIPLSDFMTKRDIVRLIVRQLSWGGRYSQESRIYFMKKEIKSDIMRIAIKLGMNTNEGIKPILAKITNIF